MGGRDDAREALWPTAPTEGGAKKMWATPRTAMRGIGDDATGDDGDW
jgi:hypothetical protein